MGDSQSHFNGRRRGVRWGPRPSLVPGSEGRPGGLRPLTKRKIMPKKKPIAGGLSASAIEADAAVLSPAGGEGQVFRYWLHLEKVSFRLLQEAVP